MNKSISDTPSNNKRPLDSFLSPVVLIRIGSILSLFLTIGHASGYPWTADQNLREKQLVASMRSADFVFAGERTSYWSMYLGWGLYVALLLLTLTIILWFLSDFARVAPHRVGIAIQIIAASCLVAAYLSFRFFYIPPFVLSSATFVILQMAAIRLLRRS